jgi:hypothetical protein
VRLRALHRYRLDAFTNGRAIGQFEATGVTPEFAARLAARGQPMDSRLFAAGPLGDATAP